LEKAQQLLSLVRIQSEDGKLNVLPSDINAAVVIILQLAWLHYSERT